MRVAGRALCLSVLMLSATWFPSVQAQTGAIDPSLLAQLSPEEKQQLLSGVSGGSGYGSSNRDQELSNPQVVRPSADSADDPYASDSAGVSQDYERQSGNGQEAPGQLDPNAGDSASQGLNGGLGSNDINGGAGGLSNSPGIPSLRMENGLQQGRRPSSYGNQVSGNVGSNRAGPGVETYSKSETTDSVRATKKIVVRPFGYELFSGVPNTFAPATDIPVPSDYVIGPGDNIRVQLFGNQNETFTLLVSRDGTINFPKLGPITTNGLKFDELQKLLEDRVSREIIGTTASVTLGRLRSIRVFVLGDVSRPGSYTVSSLSTMTHALFVSGGVNSVGSLRRVQLKRDGETVRTLDLYRFLLGGDSSNDVRLQPGDVVFVPPVTARVTVEGEIKRPAIYELAGERSLADVLALAGGALASSDQTYVEVERISASSERKVLNFDMAKQGDLSARIQDGDVVRVRKVAAQIVNEIQVLGYVKYPGVYPWSAGRDLRTVLDLAGIRASDFKAEVYLPLGAIERTDTVTGIREFSSFNLAKVLRPDSEPMPLEPNDLVIVFGRQDIAYLNSYDVEAVLSGKRVSSYKSCPGLVELRGISNSQRSVRFLRTLASESVRKDGVTRPTVVCPSVFKEVPRVLPYLLDKSVGVYGEIRRPGVYPVSDDTNLGLLIKSAAGVTSESNPKNVEYLSYEDSLAKGQSHYQTLDLTSAGGSEMRVTAGDILNLRPVYLDQEIGSVRLLGEIRFPGSYGVIRGETLSQLLERAGGLTDSAYPYGAVFTRENARKAEAASYKRAAADLQEAIVTVVTNGALGAEAASVATFLDGVIRRLENTPATGRVVIQADPTVLRVKPENEIVLEPGDVLYMPKRPASVSVAGQVLNPGSLAFKAGSTPEQYIDRAGGTSLAADRKRAFIVFPDGAAKQLKISSWNFDKQDVPPGSLIIVPRDASPLNKVLLSEKLLSIFSSLALSIAALAAINNN